MSKFLFFGLWFIATSSAFAAEISAAAKSLALDSCVEDARGMSTAVDTFYADPLARAAQLSPGYRDIARSAVEGAVSTVAYNAIKSQNQLRKELKAQRALLEKIQLQSEAMLKGKVSATDVAISAAEARHLRQIKTALEQIHTRSDEIGGAPSEDLTDLSATMAEVKKQIAATEKNLSAVESKAIASSVDKASVERIRALSRPIPAAESKKANLKMAKGALAGAMVGVAIDEMANVATVKMACKPALDSLQAVEIKSYIAIGASTSCRLSAEGLHQLSEMPEADLRALCERVPQVADLASQAFQKHLNTLAKIPVAKQVKANCDGLTLQSVSYDLGARNVKMDYRQPNPPDGLMEVSSPAPPSEGGKNLKYSIPYNLATGKYRILKTQDPLLLQGFRGTDDETLRKYYRDILLADTKIEDPIPGRLETLENLFVSEAVTEQARAQCETDFVKKAESVPSAPSEPSTVEH